ncbi:hypothetical protein YC2023_091087 [Brassica napus]
MRSLRIHPLVASTLVKGFLQSFEDLGHMSRKQEYEVSNPYQVASDEASDGPYCLVVSNFICNKDF